VVDLESFLVVGKGDNRVHTVEHQGDVVAGSVVERVQFEHSFVEAQTLVLLVLQHLHFSQQFDGLVAVLELGIGQHCLQGLLDLLEVAVEEVDLGEVEERGVVGGRELD
jgi:hypothetical protein